MRLNIGSCDLPLPQSEGWINIDNSASSHVKADLAIDGRELDGHFNAGSVDEVYAGHFVEHLTPREAEDFVAMCYGVLRPGGVLGIVTPDFHYIASRYLDDDERFAIPELVDTYVFSYKQESRHRSLWDFKAMEELLVRHGFRDVREIDRMDDARLAYPAVWQAGCQGTK